MTPKRNAAAGMPQAEPAPSLPQLCSEAADHVAHARLALFDESYDTDRALRHLDEAIDCLKRLLAHGRATQLNGANAARAGLRSA
jgi:hypothetical protein